MLLKLHLRSPSFSFFFFFNDTATTEIYTLSLHDALPIGASPVSTYTRDAYNWQAVQAGGASIFPGVTACSNPNCTGTPGLNLFSVNQNFRAPYFYNYNLQVEKSLAKAAVLQVGYVGSQGRKLSVVPN